MNYFNYQPKAQMGRVWSLFSGLAELTETDQTKHNCDYAHTLEIVNAAMSGSISTSDDNLDTFNLKAYELQCKQNDHINDIQRADKLLFIVDIEDSQEEDGRVGFGDISSRKLKTVEEAFDNVDTLNAFESNINRLLNIRKEYITTSGIDLISIIMNSLKGIPEAVNLLSSITERNKDLKELVMSLCEDGPSGILLNRLATVV